MFILGSVLWSVVWWGGDREQHSCRIGQVCCDLCQSSQKNNLTILPAVVSFSLIIVFFYNTLARYIILKITFANTVLQSLIFCAVILRCIYLYILEFSVIHFLVPLWNNFDLIYYYFLCRSHYHLCLPWQCRRKEVSQFQMTTEKYLELLWIWGKNNVTF